ncbi:hypothetical protein [Oceanithermus sp.]
MRVRWSERGYRPAAWAERVVLGRVASLVAGAQIAPGIGALGALGVAGQDASSDFIAGTALQQERSFRIGDRGRTGEHGRVEGLLLRPTRQRSRRHPQRGRGRG